VSVRQAVMAGAGVGCEDLGVFKVWGSRGWELGQSGQVSQQKNKTANYCLFLCDSVPAQQGRAEV